MEKKLKHLDFLQLIITRMNANSFLLKGWAVTLVVALFALDVSKTDINFVKIALLPILLFWLLDGYFLYQERLFRDVYDLVRLKDEGDIDFSMKRVSCPCKYLRTIFSKTLLLFHGALFVSTALILYKGGF